MPVSVPVPPWASSPWPAFTGLPAAETPPDEATCTKAGTAVPPERAAMGSGANNTARYIGSSAGVALMLALATAGTGPDTAVVVSAALAVTGAVVTLTLGRRPRR